MKFPVYLFSTILFIGLSITCHARDYQCVAKVVKVIVAPQGEKIAALTDELKFVLSLSDKIVISDPQGPFDDPRQPMGVRLVFDNKRMVAGLKGSYRYDIRGETYFLEPYGKMIFLPKGKEKLKLLDMAQRLVSSDNKKLPKKMHGTMTITDRQGFTVRYRTECPLI